MIWPFPNRETMIAPEGPLPRPGAGTRLTAKDIGFTYSVPSRAATFDHPWKPSMFAFQMRMRRGTVYSTGGDGPREPVIKVGGKTVPMSGDATHGQPALVLDPKMANEAGESWVVLEVVPNASGEIVKASRVEIVHTDTPLSHALTLGRQPLAMVLWRNGVPMRALEISFFNLRYVRMVDPVGARHLFL